jgi:hypothetical protein
MKSTLKMTSEELKELLKPLADSSHRFGIFSENGPFQGFYAEDHTDYDYEVAGKVAKCLAKNMSRIAVVDLRDDRLTLHSVAQDRLPR